MKEYLEQINIISKIFKNINIYLIIILFEY